MIPQAAKQSAENGNTASSASSRPPAPDILIHLHIAKTGGTSLSGMVKHGFGSNEIFEWTRHGVELYTGLGVVPHECCERYLRSFGLNRIRYISGHVPFGVHRVLDRPAKYITVLRHPVERVISLFYFLMQMNVPFRKDGRLLTFEEYVESRCDINLNDYQVRVVTGCPVLDAEISKPGEMVTAAPVEPSHLNQAKRNIDEQFLSIAPVEQMTELGLLVRRIYGWPMRRLQNEYKNSTKDRPRLREISPRLIKIIEECNSHDIELYEWVSKRFAEQRRLFEPELSRDLRVYRVVNRALSTAGQILPRSVRKHLAEVLFYSK
jgi:hypothetical protein